MKDHPSLSQSDIPKEKQLTLRELLRKKSQAEKVDNPPVTLVKKPEAEAEEQKVKFYQAIGTIFGVVSYV
ncbi:hypothetical protein STA3757_05600 [Stanieria sp. NIES-3757]|nr:hypothetical protein STA3757_05600 [Stanieria sp. NIES-3757]